MSIQFNVPNEKYAEVMGIEVHEIDYDSPSYNAFVAGLQAGHEQAMQIAGLGRVTNEDDGYLTLQFSNEDMACQFMQNYQLTVEVDDMPEMREDPVVYRRIRTKDRPPEPGLILKGWDRTGSIVKIIYNGDPKMANCDWWMPIPTDTATVDQAAVLARIGIKTK